MGGEEAVTVLVNTGIFELTRLFALDGGSLFVDAAALADFIGVDVR